MNPVAILGRSESNDWVLTGPALDLVVELVRAFRPRVEALLGRRLERQLRFDKGEKPDFLPRPRPSAPGRGRSRRQSRTCRIGGWRSPGPSTGRW